MLKKNLLLVTVALLTFAAAKANTDNGSDPDAGGAGKKVNEINGIVLHAFSKKPLENVSITAYETSKKEKVVLTDSNGNYGINELKPGTYKITFEKSGFKKVTRDKVVVKADEEFLLNVEMIEDSGTQLYPTPLHFMY